MENDQKFFRNQNYDSRPKTYGSYNNLNANQNKPNTEGNWRSKGLESVSYPSNNFNNNNKKNFSDYNNQNNFRNNNVNSYNSFNQNTYYNK